MPEEVEHKLPGSVDLLMKMFENDKSLYLGESFSESPVFAGGVVCVERGG